MPLFAYTVINASLSPIQVSNVTTTLSKTGPGVFVTVADPVCEHSLASVTVTVYVPAPTKIIAPIVPFGSSQMYVYGEVPPETVTAASPPLEQIDGVGVTIRFIALGSLTTAVSIAVHPFKSVTVTVYDPGLTTECVGFGGNPPVQLYVSGAFPPVTVTDKVPSAIPLQLASVLVAVTDIKTGSVTCAESAAEQPTESIIRTAYVPAQSVVMVKAVSPVFQISDQELSVPVPPLGLPVIEPLQSPLQVTSVTVKVPAGAAGSVTCVESAVEQPNESIIRTAYVPAQSVVMVKAVSPVFQISDQELAEIGRASCRERV